MVSLKKNLIFLTIALAVAIVAVSASSLRAGSRRPRDVLICSQNVNIRAQYGKVVNTQRICNAPRWNQTITQIVATDLGRYGKGGYAQITKGGVGHRNVTLYLWSQKSQPLNFTISVYAH